ncbi:hypothetical protein DAMA08_035340 [Martiniozyma asiatica (nom. inval.)]|nr:hypothetical protein DAMA08_035340 [Martiniozyma asiatica]
MQFKALVSIVLATQALAAYVPSEPWSTLTPSKTLSGGSTNYSATFGIAINPISTASSASLAVKNKALNKAQAVTQIGDGQLQGATSTYNIVATQIGDGQIQAPTAASVAVVTQIGDGQIQAATKQSVAVVTQIGDGQIQAATTTTKQSVAVVTQIGDGQVQAATSTTKKTTEVATQIGDGQVQAATTTKKTTEVATQIGDGQVQASTAKTTKTATGATQIGDGQVQASAASTSTSTSASTATGAQLTSCLKDGSLAMTLKDSILTDSKGRIGSIVANQQFQFDGPPPQAGAIYAAGWSVSEDGLLAIGDKTTFYQCLSGDFYNLYDEHIGSECHPVELLVVDLVKC